MNSCIFGWFFFKANWIETSLIEFDLNKRFVIHVRSSLIKLMSVSIINNHVNLIEMRIHVVTEQHGEISLIDLKFQTCQFSLDNYLHGARQTHQKCNQSNNLLITYAFCEHSLWKSKFNFQILYKIYSAFYYVDKISQINQILFWAIYSQTAL